MDRRNWLTAALAVLAGPLFAQTRAGRVARIGIIAAYAPNSRESSHLWIGFFEGMHELGYVEGRDFVIEGRYYGDRPERLPALAAEVVAANVDVIVVGSPPVPEAARRATSTIPIVMTNHSDPLASGLVGNLSRPGGNVTGISLSGSAWRGKHVQLLHEVVPGARAVAVLANPSIATHAYELKELRTAARMLGLRILVVDAQRPEDFPAAFAKASSAKADAIVFLPSATHFGHRERLAQLAMEARLPAMGSLRQFAEAGALFAYGPDLRDGFRRSARYVDRILKGAKPGELPIEQPTKFELVVNLATARRLGLSIPHGVLARADRIIE